MESLGSRLKLLRKKKGYTQEQMAEKLEMSRSNYGGYEVDRILPPSDVLDRLGDILDTSTDYLLGKTGSSLPTSADERFIDSLELSDIDIIEKFNLTLDGRTLTTEQMKLAISFLRTVQKSN